MPPPHSFSGQVLYSPAGLCLPLDHRLLEVGACRRRKRGWGHLGAMLTHASPAFPPPPPP